MLLPGDPGYNPGGTSPGGTETNPGPTQGEPGPQYIPNHSDALGIYGLPPDVAAEVDRIFRQYSDPAAAAQAAVAYIRGTQWYAQQFPGIKEARALGFIGTELNSEREYKQIYAQYNALYKQYYGRAMTWDEAYRLFSSGADPNFVGHQFAGAAFIGANKNDIQYLAGAFTDQGRLSGDQLTALGNENAGIDSPMGAKLQAAIQQASAKLSRIFQGQSATPGLQLGGAGLSAPALQGTKIGQTPDIQA